MGVTKFFSQSYMSCLLSWMPSATAAPVKEKLQKKKFDQGFRGTVKNDSGLF